MIVREILQNPSIIDNFDYFNDSKDTINWLKSMDENADTPQEKWKIQELIKQLEFKTDQYFKKMFKS